MSDYSDLINSSFGRTNPALPQVVGNVDEDPDKAQRALDLAKATGVNSSAIYGDLDEFERQHKAVMASDIVANNPHLSDFVQSNPMVPKIANDDYGQLDAVSQKVTGMSLPMRILRAPERLAEHLFDGDPLKRWKEGGPLGSWLKSEDIENYPMASATAAGLATPIELFMRGVGGVIETAGDVAGQVGGRDIKALVEAEAMGLTGRTPMMGHMKDFERARPWVDNGREPLPTALPEYDKFITKQNADDLKGLKEATSEAQKSVLRDRNPDLFKQFIDQHTDAEIGVSGEVVAKLYGDKLPEADDNLLGWVPGIEDKLALARSTGADVNIPLSDWLAHAEPDLMQALHDDIRVRPNGITANEAKLAAESEPQAPLPETMPSIRAASALEPLYSVGDRKLQIERRPVEMKGDVIGADQWRILDEKGNKVAHLEITPLESGKKLYVDGILGMNGLGARDFGPALMRDLLRQVKQEYPEAQQIGGFRISGARGAAHTENETWVKLDRTDAHEGFRKILEDGQWETYSPNIQAYIKPDFARSEADRDLVNIVTDELDRIVPKKVAIQGAETISARTGGLEGQLSDEKINVGGAYIRYKETYPIILYALDSQNTLGAARHEAIHHLRNYGFFKPDEWSTLEAEALAGGWLKKYNIDSRYPTARPDLKLEEAVAEAYQDWAGRQDTLKERAKSLIGIESPLDTIFRRMKQFFDAIRERVGALLGKDPQWEDIFQRVSTGEVGGREGKPLDPRAFDEKFSIPDDPSRVFERAAALGMTVDQFRRYDELIAKRHAEDIESATKRAMEERGREQTKQWKDDRKALRQEVAEDIRQRPDVAADLFFGAQELYGKKLEGKVKLAADSLTPEQKAGLPRDYYGADGIHPDDVANIFGHGSGDVMVEKLIQYNAAKQLANMSAKDFVSRVTDIETDRQMQIKHGVLEDNIIDAVKEQVTGETQQNLLHEETVALGMKAGKAPLDKATVLAQLRDQFAKMPLGSVDSSAYMRAAGKAGRQAELALLSNDPAAAFVAKQQQYYATVIANEASKLEREIGQFDKAAKRFSKREITTVDQEYANFIHDVLLKVGKPVRRSVQDLQGEIAAGEYKSLQDFVEGKQSFGLREMPVADFLFDDNFRKAFDDLTVDEFRGVNDSIKTMIKNGRDEKKITKAGTEADLAEIKAQMIEQLKQFQEKTYDAKGGRWMGPIPPKLAKVLRTYGISHIQMENLFNRWDHDNPNGVFQQYVMRDLVDAANSESAMEKRYASKLRDIDDKADLKKQVDNILFKVPGTDQVMTLNRGNLRTVMLNVGNKSNLDKLARGYKLKPEEVLSWIDRHATKEDWDWAQKMGDIFAEIKGEADTMYRGLSGVAPESIPLEPITTPHGEYKGWYYPVIYHPEFEGPSKKLMGKDALEQEGFVRATTPAGYTKSRTGYAGPMALDLDMMPARMKQMIHDIAMRPSIINASKIFYDKDIRSTVFSRFGAEWRDMLVPYLVDVANSANYMPKNQRIMANAGEFMRQNIISTLVGLNPGTVLKHGPTALVQSLHEVGPVDFLKAMKGLFSVNERTGETNWQFAMKESEELQRRHQNYIETLGGATDLLQPKEGFTSLRNTVQRFSAMPVAISDLLSAVPTWMAQYGKTIDEGATHGDAVYMADRAVRRAHGSVAITNRSGVMRGGALSQWFASVYGFFNHIMNRQYEMLWKAGEMVGDAKAGNYTEAMQRAPELTSMLFAYVLAPALIEEMVTPLMSTENESWGKKAAKGIAFTLGASWVGIRDISNALLNGRDPSVGLISTTAKTVTDFGRDLNKSGPFNKEHAGKIIKDGTTLMGALSGVVPAQTGRVAEFGYGVSQGTERPKGPWGWLVGARYGTLKGHSRTFDEWQRHH
jgi:hypothetical protein